jgi:hypothetical protein
MGEFVLSDITHNWSLWFEQGNQPFRPYVLLRVGPIVAEQTLTHK